MFNLTFTDCFYLVFVWCKGPCVRPLARCTLSTVFDVAFHFHDAQYGSSRSVALARLGKQKGKAIILSFTSLAIADAEE